MVAKVGKQAEYDAEVAKPGKQQEFKQAAQYDSTAVWTDGRMIDGRLALL